MKKIWQLLLGVLGITTIFVPLPDELRLPEGLPNYLRWSVVLGAALLIARLQYPRHVSLNGLKNFLGLGISWDKDIGISTRSRTIDGAFTFTVTGVHLRGFNNSKNVRSDAKATLFLGHAPNLRMRVTTSDGSMDHAAQVDIGPHLFFNVDVQFEAELEEKDFIERYTPMTVKVSWNGGNYEQVFSKKTCKAYIAHAHTLHRPEPARYLGR